MTKSFASIFLQTLFRQTLIGKFVGF